MLKKFKKILPFLHFCSNYLHNMTCKFSYLKSLKYTGIRMICFKINFTKISPLPSSK